MRLYGKKKKKNVIINVWYIIHMVGRIMYGHSRAGQWPVESEKERIIRDERKKK